MLGLLTRTLFDLQKRVFAKALEERQTDKQTYTENYIQKMCTNFVKKKTIFSKKYFEEKQLATIV